MCSWPGFSPCPRGPTPICSLHCCGNTELIDQCYETELTCEDTEIGPIIRDRDQLSVVGGGSGGFGPEVVDHLHPDVDGQSVLGRPSFAGTATGPTGSQHTDVVFDDLEWTCSSSEPVPTGRSSRGTIESGYRK